MVAAVAGIMADGTMDGDTAMAGAIVMDGITAVTAALAVCAVITGVAGASAGDK